MKYEEQVAFNTSVERVWDLLINPEKTRKYMFGCAVMSDWGIGNDVVWKANSEDGTEIIVVKGEVLECVENERLSMTMFDPNMGLDDIPRNYLKLTYSLESKNDQTVLTITQTGYDQVENGAQRLEDSRKGWNAVIPLMQSLLQ